MRETWLRGRSGFQIDHCIPSGQDRERLLDYDNLVYTCPWCNRTKSAVPMPNPTEVAYGKALHVNEDGIIEAGNDPGLILIQGLRLDHPDITYQRRMVLRVVRLAEERNNVPILLRLLGCPEDLPDLKKKRPPGGNTRPAGARNSWLEKRRRSELSLIY